MAAAVTVLTATWPAGLPSGLATVAVSPGDDYTAGGEPIADAVQAALTAHFGTAVNAANVLPASMIQVSMCRDYLGETLGATLVVYLRESPSQWTDEIAVDGATDIGELPDNTKAVYAVEGLGGGNAGPRDIMHTAAGVGEVNVDIIAKTVTFAGADDNTGMRVLYSTAETEVADGTNLADVSFVFLVTYERAA